MAKKNDKRTQNKAEKKSYVEISRELKTGGPQRLYLLYGQEDYLREAFLGELKALCLPDGGDDFSYHRLEGKDMDMRQLEEAVNALPFLSERTMTEVRGYELSRCRDAEAAEYCTLVFVQDTGYEPDQRQKAVKTLKQYGKLLNFSSQGQAPLVKWIARRFAALGKTVTPDACIALIYSSGELMNGLIPEIEKLAAGVRGDTVSAKDVERMALRRPEARIFDMTDCLAARDYDGAARILADLIAMGEEPIVTVAGIGTQMRRLYAARLAIDERLGPDFVKNLYKINYSFILDKLMRSARGFTLEALAEAVRLCAETDYAMKSSSADDTELLCDLLIKLAAVSAV